MIALCDFQSFIDETWAYAVLVILILLACAAACYIKGGDDTRKCDPYPDAWDEDGKWEEDE